MAYVGGGPGAGCIFCDKPAEQRDEANFILYRGESAFVMLNLYPYNTGHLMIAPFAHLADLWALPDQAGIEMWSLTRQALAALNAEYRPDGYNVGMNLGQVAGAGVPGHLHLHVVPRWNGDTNFMPVVADTKVMPETLDQTYRRLRARLAPPSP